MSSAYYRGILSGRKKELRDYERRREQLGTVRSGYASFDSDASDLNQNCRNVSTSIQNAIKIFGGSNYPWELWGQMDGGSGDGNVWNSKSCVETEIRRVDAKIAELNDSINSLNYTIAREEARERAEAEAARERARAEAEARKNNRA